VRPDVEHGQVVAGGGVVRVEPQRLLVAAPGRPGVALVGGDVGEPQVGAGLVRRQHDGPGGDVAGVDQPAGQLQDVGVVQHREGLLRREHHGRVPRAGGLVVPAEVGERERADPVHPLVLRARGRRGVGGGQGVGGAIRRQQDGGELGEQRPVPRFGHQRPARLALGVVEAAQRAEVRDAVGRGVESVAAHRFRFS
jgi:hypothetical protein